MLEDLLKYRSRVQARSHALLPDIRWDGSRRKVDYLEEALLYTQPRLLASAA